MQDYTFDRLQRHRLNPDLRLGRWALSFLVANSILLGLVGLLEPLLRALPQPAPAATETVVEWTDAPPTQLLPSAVAAKPLQPPVTTQRPIQSPPPEPTQKSPPPPEPPKAPTPPARAQTAALPPPPPPPPAAPKPASKVPPEERFEGRPLAINDHATPNEARPADAPFAGVDNAQARSSHPTPGMHDPLPAQPNGVAGEVLAIGTAGDAATAAPGRTLQETKQPVSAPGLTAQKAPAQPVPSAAPTATATAAGAVPPSAPTEHVTEPAAAHGTVPTGGRVESARPGTGQPQAAGAPPGTAHPPRSAALPTESKIVEHPAASQVAATPAHPGIGPGEALPLPAATPQVVPAAAPAVAPGTQALPAATAGGAGGVGTAATAVGAGGHAVNGQGTNRSSTTPTGAAEGSATPRGNPQVQAEAYIAQAAAAAAQAQSAPPAGRSSTLEIQQAPTKGDADAVTKTPLWNMRLNTENAGPDTMETYRDPVARYLKDYRRILEQSFFREASPPRSLRFRDGEYADFEMTFHEDGTIDEVNLVPDSATKNFTPEMIAICKTAIERSGPYRPFTDELRKDRKKFQLVVRFQF
ncbi:MAG: hypothetical protein ACREJ2_12675 [Planctomycetota bacterium]